MGEFDQIKYNNEYNRQAYDRIGVMVPKGTKTIWRENAAKMGLSLNAYIIRAVEEYAEKK